MEISRQRWFANDPSWVKCTLFSKDFSESDRYSLHEDFVLTGLASFFNVTIVWVDDNCSRAFTFPLLSTEHNHPLIVVCLLNNAHYYLRLKREETLLWTVLFGNLWKEWELVRKIKEVRKVTGNLYGVLEEIGGKIRKLREKLAEKQRFWDQIVHLLLEKSRLPEKRQFSLGIKLVCGHWIENWAENIEKCPICSEKLTFSDFSVIFGAESDRIRSMCTKCCQNTRNVTAIRLQCGHFVCKKCVVFAEKSVTFTCSVCNQSELLAKMTVKCDKCGQLRKSTFFPQICYENNTICYNCFESPSKWPLSGQILPQNEQICVQKWFFNCKNCKNAINRSHLFTQGLCICEVCIKCVEEMMVEREIFGNICPFCDTNVKSEERSWFAVRVKGRIDRKRRENEEKAAKERAENDRKAKELKETEEKLKAEQRIVEAAKAPPLPVPPPQPLPEEAKTPPAAAQQEIRVVAEPVPVVQSENLPVKAEKPDEVKEVKEAEAGK